MTTRCVSGAHFCMQMRQHEGLCNLARGAQIPFIIIRHHIYILFGKKSLRDLKILQISNPTMPIHP